MIELARRACSLNIPLPSRIHDGTRPAVRVELYFGLPSAITPPKDTITCSPPMTTYLHANGKSLNE